MRIPKSEFTDADLKLCRAHGASVAHGRVMTASQPHDDAEWSHRWERAEAIAAFETEICMPADLPLPPSYDEDLEHWLKTLAPAKPASPKPEPTADVWHSEAPSVPGVYIASADRSKDVLSYWDGSKWHCGVGNAGDARKQTPRKYFPVEWLRLIEADAPAKPLPSASSFAPGDRIVITRGDDHYFFTGDTGTVVAVDSDGDLQVRFDSNSRAKKGCAWFVRPTRAARLAPTSSAADGAALVGAKLKHSVCIKAHNYASFVDYPVGAVIPVRHESIPRYRECWLPCVEDGWIPHTPTADSVCPVPDGVRFEARYGDGTPVDDTESTKHGDCIILWRATTGSAPCNDIVAWRPIAKDA